MDVTVPPGAQPREVVLEVIVDTFDAAMELAQPANQPPQLREAICLADAALARNDEGDLDRHLRDVSIAAMATRVRMRCADVPDTPEEANPS